MFEITKKDLNDLLCFLGEHNFDGTYDWTIIKVFLSVGGSMHQLEEWLRANRDQDEPLEIAESIVSLIKKGVDIDKQIDGEVAKEWKKVLTR